MPTRKLNIHSCELFRSGTTNGHDWTLYKVQAQTADGAAILEDLVSFEALPKGIADYELERRERTYRRTTYVSFLLRPVDAQPRLPANPLVPDGRYAVQVDGDWRFYRVWRGTRNPYVQHLYAVKGVEKGDRVRGPEEHKALALIDADPGAAAIEFGRRTGSCSKCGKDLEVNLSRHLGIGPVCLRHWYAEDDWKVMIAKATAELKDAGIDPADKLDSLEAVTA